jgi:hypothetical protein
LVAIELVARIPATPQSLMEALQGMVMSADPELLNLVHRGNPPTGVQVVAVAPAEKALTRSLLTAVTLVGTVVQVLNR